MIYTLPEEKNHAGIIFFCRFLSTDHQNICSIWFEISEKIEFLVKLLNMTADNCKHVIQQ